MIDGSPDPAAEAAHGIDRHGDAARCERDRHRYV